MCILIVYESNVPGPEQPTINNLVHAANLITQQWTHGMTYFKAFKLACISVYVKNQHIYSQYLKNKIQDTIQQILIKNKYKLIKFKLNLKDCICYQDTTYNMQGQSSFAMMQRQTVLLAGCLKAMSKLYRNDINFDKISLKDVVELNVYHFKTFKSAGEVFLDMKLVDLIPNMLVHAYSSLSRRNISLINLFLKTICDSYEFGSKEKHFVDKILKVSLDLQDKLINFLDKTDDTVHVVSMMFDQGDLPWDARRLPVMLLNPKMSRSWSTENRIIAFLNYIFRLGMNEKSVADKIEEMEIDQPEPVKKTFKWQSMTAIEYSSAVKEGRLSDLVTDEPIISNLSNLLSNIDICVLSLLKSNHTKLRSGRFFNLVSAMEWRHRLNKIGEMNLFSPQHGSNGLPKVSENVKTLLTLHYKWLSKWLMSSISELYKSNPALSSSPEFQELTKIVSQVEISLSNYISPLLSLAKKVRQVSGQPLPLVSTEEAELTVMWDKLSRSSSFYKPCIRQSDFENKISWIVSPEGRQCRNKLLDVKLLLLSNEENLKEAADSLEDINALLKESMLLYEEQKPYSEIIKKKINPGCIPEIKLWPIHDFILLKLNTAFRKHLIEIVGSNWNDMDVEKSDSQEIETIPRSKLNQAFCNWSKWLQTFPPGVLASAIKVANQQRTGKAMINHQHVASVLLEQYSLSPAVKNSDVWLNWAEKDIAVSANEETLLQSDEYFTENKDLSNILAPLLSQSVVSLLLPEPDKASAIESLRAHKDRTVLLNALKTTLWRNLSVLSSRQLDRLNNEERCIRKSFENFIRSLECSLISKGILNKPNETESKDLSLTKINNGLTVLVKSKESKKFCYPHQFNEDNPVEALPQTLLSIDGAINGFSSVKDDLEKWFLIGQSWAYIGLSQLILYSCIEVIDPVHKNALKLEYTIEEKEHWERTLCVEYVQSVIEGKNKFPYQKDIENLRDNLLEKENKLRKFVAVRPDPPLFNALINELLHAMRSVCSVSNIRTILKKLSTCCYNRNKESTDKVLNETKIWIQSIDSFTTKFNTSYGTWYPDVTTPILVAIAQIKYGMQLMFSSVKKITIKQEANVDDKLFSLDKLLSLLAQYPLPQISTALDLIEFCTSDTTLKLLKMSSIVINEDGENEEERNESFRLAKFCLEEIQNIVKIKGDLNEEWLEIGRILDFVVISWERQEEDRKQKLLAEESLYINKARKFGDNLTEEEEDEMSILEIFNPNQDFSDIEKSVSLEDDCKVKPIMEPKDKLFKLTLSDIQDIHRIHFELVKENTVTHWLMSQKNQEPVLNFTSPFLERFTIFKMLLNKFGEACRLDLDMNVGPGLCFATDVISMIGHCESTEEPIKGKHYDFYNDPHVAEVKQCSNLLNKVTDRVEQLRNEWPDHPTLNQMIVIINRIMGFEATSPVSRFLTGLELLMSKMKEWEENAHSGVSLATHMSMLTQQVLGWRKLELSCWKGCLLATRNRLKGEVSKWWFYLYSLTASFLRSKLNNGDKESEMDTGEFEVVNENEMIVALQKFMEKSTLVQFTSRIQLLYNFHCHAANLNVPGHYELTNIFWNMYQYYSQFKTVIEHHISEMSGTIEKNLKDFVKIARWNDISYWSVKENVDRNYRNLHKYIKEYEAILNEPAVTAMTKIESNTKNLIVSVLPTIKVEDYLTNSSSKISNEEKQVFDKDSVLVNDTKFLKKAKNLCTTIIQYAEYSNLIETVNEFSDEIISTAQKLRDMQVDTTLPKEKQKSQAKNILQQKRKSLADLFKMLSDLGLSYRTGLVYHASDSESLNDHFVLPPIDVKVALDLINKRSVDKDLLSAWNGCENHFWHAIARSTQLKLTAQHPHKELGPSNIQRCCGFTNHLLKLSVDQKRIFSESVQSLYLLRCQSVQLNDYNDAASVGKHEEEQFIRLKEELQYLLNDSIYYLEQFKVLLNACPSESTSSIGNEHPLSCNILDESMLGPMLKTFKGNSIWQDTNTKLNDCVKIVKKAKNQLDKYDSYSRFIKSLIRTNQNLFNDKRVDEVKPIDLITFGEFNKVQDVIIRLGKMVEDLNDVKKLFDLNLNQPERSNPFVDSLDKLSYQLKNKLDSFTSLYNNCKKKTSLLIDFNKINESEQVVSFKKKLDEFVNKLLISIQEIYKKYKNSINVNEKQGEDKMEDEPAIKKDHLKQKIIKNIFDDVVKLNLKDITYDVQCLIQSLHSVSSYSEKRVCKRLFKHCGPIFDQFLLLVHFIVTQQLSALRVSSKLCSILLALFIDLAQKGFCTPEHLLNELEREGDETVAGGIGLGDGEGEKDVSDQIETQDQLEDARPKGEQKEEDDKDCKEEEKGVEMSDDFGGKLQDIDKKDIENQDQDSDKEEEPDKEMGETEKGAETLDQQIWGSDSEDDGEEDKEMKEEEGDKGEQISDKEWGAQEEGKEPQQDQSNKNEEDKKEEINEMEDKGVIDDQVDPYHGNQQPEIEPEELDIPEDLNLDGEEGDGEEEQNEENPMEIDKIIEQKEPEEDNQGDGDEEGQKKSDQISDEKGQEDISDEEDGGADGEGKTNEEEEDVEKADSGEEKENKIEEDGGKKDEDKSGEEQKPEEEQKEVAEDETVKPSEDVPSVQQGQSAEQSSGSKDQVAQQPELSSESKQLLPEESTASEGPEQEGFGQSQQENNAQAGHGGAAAEPVKASQSKGEEEKRKRPGHTEDDRALGNITEPLKKKMKTMNVEQEDDREIKKQTNDEGIKEDEAADLYQHITEANKMESDIQVMDAATKEQTEKQSIPNKDDETGEELKKNDDVMEEGEDDNVKPEEAPKERSELLPESGKESNDGQKVNTKGKDIIEMQTNMEIDGKVVTTEGPSRGDETTYHTKWDELKVNKRFSRKDIEELHKQGCLLTAEDWALATTSEKASETWSKLNTIVSGLASELSEQLRLVLDPTTASRLKGDFRTGRRINMRKVIPYIASQFRKDKIWLRRTKPSKRDYQIILAMDDSSSMADSNSKELAFESLALVSKALTLLEVGQLGVVSFGEVPKILHTLEEPFTENNGANLLEQLTFEQKNTCYGSLVDFCSSLFTKGKGDNAQLLVIVSDGRGIFNEGESKVRSAIRRARSKDIFMVFIIVDSLQNKDSILDIRKPIFVDGQITRIASYMDFFPFPFYLILRDINGLPLVLCDALRQWFELVANLN